MLRGSAEDGLRLEGSIPPSMTPGRARAADAPPEGPRRRHHAVELAVHDAGGDRRPRARGRQHRRLDARRRARACAPACSRSASPRPTSRPASSTSSPARARWRATRSSSHPDTVAVGFIGSTATGRRIAQRAAGKTLLLEMGGNGPLVVLDDADVGAAADAAITACFLCAGQSCTAGERLLVHEAVRKDFVAALAERALAQSRLGDPLLEGTQMGPLNNEPVAAKMDAHVQDAVMRGAAVVAGRRARRRLPHRPLLAGDDPRRRPRRRARRDRGDVRADRADRRHRLARGGDRADQRLALRADGGDLHQRPAQGPALRGRGAHRAS